MAINSSIFKQEAIFVAGAAKIEQLPNLHLPQVAFVGKSNVGKSSLINKLCNRRSLARVSHTPGRTQQINFFSLDRKLLLVDLPGYGFAKVSGNQRANWERLISFYLRMSDSLRLVNLLVDSRRGIKENDSKIIEFLSEAQLNLQIIFTKSDQIKSHDEFVKDMKKILLLHGYDKEILLTSSKNNKGIQELRHSILNEVNGYNK
ncbi:MAG TPA: ribosome biogenesis GTP-binding protein YihA/YsxC [Candidatus Megaira endosymbiont of Nemacystus decipiens]|nr:ribosome biogenesis GTP-binding protein YihA/YsxC [Candidatus Megaera endosymbiont of Nemacystus decipiens]